MSYDDDVREVSELFQEYRDDLNYLNTIDDKEGYIQSNEQQLEDLDSK